MLERDVHVKVLYIDIHIADSFLVLLTLLIELFDHFLQISDVLCIFCNASSVSERLSQN